MSPFPADHAVAAPLSSFSASVAGRFARRAFRILTRADEVDPCHPRPNIDLCEKPNASNSTTAIVVGTLGGLLAFVTIATLVILHIRHQRKDEREWPKNSQQELDDYGVGPMPAAPPKSKSAYQKPRADADDGADYLPPPRRRDSLQSLARSIRGTDSAYRSRPDDTSHAMKPVEPLSQV
ncbi:hypothetical protein GGS23DRAFT_263333 [Durotheca rogersii]|uniref:uncharacterized protein n=1 Tax=Durotheca rogersii TaxID=419775 RepID=UPI0022211880|nr:uncharacterized protein GGS23DRAFT_263333 [Durotheca rogersii]KAI5859839.1 hypothetical protein GGS23DRAFT_263333 [Durotheca rogersii]